MRITSPALGRVRRALQRTDLDAILVTGTDPFLNEYVAPEYAPRTQLCGFRGSNGLLVVSSRAAILVTDGRYELQARQEAAEFALRIVRSSGSSIKAAASAVLSLAPKASKPKSILRLGLDPERLSVAQASTLAYELQDRWILVPADLAKLEVSTPDPFEAHGNLRSLPESAFGATRVEKAKALNQTLRQNGLDGLMVQALDDIAYLTNLRGTHFLHQATFPARAVFLDSRLYLGAGRDLRRQLATVPLGRFVQIVDHKNLFSELKDKLRGKRISVDPSCTSMAVRDELLASGADVVNAPSPLVDAKAHKNAIELGAMCRGFQRADRVIKAAIALVKKQVALGKGPTELQVAAWLEEAFRASGAVSLSFAPIVASGKNGAAPHHQPSRRRIQPNDLVLIDAGAHYEEGYATDLTRTFFAGRSAPSDQQRTLYTIVLKGAIAGMSATLPTSATGGQLDTIVREKLWRHGLAYAHGTGHGVGINVHEYPPRIGTGSTTQLAVGQVFSVEPGYYDPTFGGIRIENLCTVEAQGHDFLQVRPLTFAPLDRRLIDGRLLSLEEKTWLRGYNRQTTGD
jgi:Xaa-Pro aminopeptidase